MFVELHRKDNGNQVTVNSNYVVYFITHYSKEQPKEDVHYTQVFYDPIGMNRVYKEELEDKFVPDGTEIYINGCTTMLVVSETYEEVSMLFE